MCSNTSDSTPVESGVNAAAGGCRRDPKTPARGRPGDAGRAPNSSGFGVTHVDAEVRRESRRELEDLPDVEDGAAQTVHAARDADLSAPQVHLGEGRLAQVQPLDPAARQAHP